jgi:hypothetical protein
MQATIGNAGGVAVRVWNWTKAQIVGKVPDEIGLCAFDCNKGQCTQEEWAKCERRLSSAAGELTPFVRK